MRSHLVARNACRRCLAHRHVALSTRSITSLSARHGGALPALARPAAPLRQTFLARPSALGDGVGGTQRRTVFGMSERRMPRELKEQQVEPGYDVLLQFRQTVQEDTRAPPRNELVQAFQDFFTYKYQYNKPVNSTQAEWMVRLFEHLNATRPAAARHGAKGEDGEDGEEISTEELRMTREALATPPVRQTNENMRYHAELSKLIHYELHRRRSVTPADFKRNLDVMCLYGLAVEASELLNKTLKSGWYKRDSRRAKEMQVVVLQGLAREGREELLLREAANAETDGLEYMPLFHETMTTFYARRNNLEKTKEWFERPIKRNMAPTLQTYRELLGFAQRSKDSASKDTSDATAKAAKQKWVEERFEALCDANPRKEYWDIIFQWATVCCDKGVEEIRHMVGTMLRNNHSKANMEPDADTINGLVSAVIARGDVLLAERFLQMGQQMRIEPDAQTYILQLEYRTKANDLSGAYESFQKLLTWDCPGKEDAAVINLYLRTLCAQPQPNTARISTVVEVVEERQTAMEPMTVVGLCLHYLHNDRQFDVIDVLSMHAMQYSAEERAAVRDAMIDYIVDRRNTSTARAWDAYSLLRQYFGETPAERRAVVMDSFFRRRRPDYAAFVFGHMRGMNNPELRPTTDLYVRVLEGLGKTANATGLHMVHNMLKMDTRIQMETRLYNALMLAYTTSGNPSRALDFWQDISMSAEGPSYASLAIVFWVCEHTPFGDGPARSIWAKVQRMEIDVPPNVFDAYCGAIAGQGKTEEVRSLISGMVKSVGYGPTPLTLGISYNALPGQGLQETFARWASLEHTDLWAKVQKHGCKVTADGLRKYNIVREMKA